MEIWRAGPGDVVRLPASCYPRVVTVTDSVYAAAEYDRLHWRADGARGSTVLPRALQVDLLQADRPDKQAFLSANARPAPASPTCAPATSPAGAPSHSPEREAEAG